MSDDEEYGHMDHGGGLPQTVPRHSSGNESPPPFVPRGNKPSTCMHKQYHEADVEDTYETVEVIRSPWFAGNLSREEAEAKLKSGTAPGNFLIRKKGGTGRIFVHSYLSLARMQIIHNIIEFDASGACTVDSKPWEHHRDKVNGPSLEEVVDKMQEIRRSRKKATPPDARITAAVQAAWPWILHSGSVKSAVSMIHGMTPGSFIICKSIAAGVDGYALIAADQDRKAIVALCPNSSQGYYLKYSELVSPSMPQLAAAMIANPKSLMMCALGCPLRIIKSSEGDAMLAKLTGELDAAFDEHYESVSDGENYEDIYDDKV